MQIQDYRSPKVTVIGAGNVGGMLAQRIAKQNLADVVLCDIVQGKPQGIALDLAQAHTISNLDRQIIGTNDYSDTQDSDVIVITAGLPRKEGMSRNDPLDVMTYLAWQVSGLPPQRVVGMAGVLDAARFQTFIAMELGISTADIYTTVLGGHGGLMLPLPRLSTVNGVPITELMSQETIARLVERTRNGGAEIVKLLQNGSAYFAPSAAAYVMVEAIISDRHRIFPAAAHLTGEYGLKDIFMGVPVQLGRKGVEKVIELKLTDDELAALHASAKSIQENINLL